ncbi:MAG: sulfurtransferase [Gammaproteobacteria bacterium]
MSHQGSLSGSVRYFLFAILLLTSLTARASDPLVTASWMKENLYAPGQVVLDLQPPAMYQRYHIPGAINAPYEFWRTGDDGAPGMLPPLERLERMLGRLGVSADSHVVLTTTGLDANHLAEAARVFWTLKLLGHQRVSVLDGGLNTYANEFGGKLDSGKVKPRFANYTASPDFSLLVTGEQMEQALKDGVTLVDGRSRGEYLGIVTGGDEERAGTIPGAINLPHHWLSEDSGGTLRDRASIERLFDFAGADTSAGAVHFCHTGSRAALNWFVDYAVLGNVGARLYDGSMSDWARKEQERLGERPVTDAVGLAE